MRIDEKCVKEWVHYGGLEWYKDKERDRKSVWVCMPVC